MSQDLYYSKEEFAQFIEDAAVMGVEVVPEIDTPAHSLALTKYFRSLGFPVIWRVLISWICPTRQRRSWQRRFGRNT